MEDSFNRFIEYGIVGTKEQRESTAYSIFDLVTKSDVPESNKFELEYYESALKSILQNEDLRELCRQDKTLGVKVTNEVLDFINQSQKVIIKTINPFENEYQLLRHFKSITVTNYKKEWNSVSVFLKSSYAKNTLDCGFYENEFKQSLDIKNRAKDKSKFEIVKQLMVEKWVIQLFKKQTDWELEIIEQERKKFCNDLYKKIEELKKIKDIISPFTNELGRMWDMSNGNWNRLNFNLLQHYSELLKKDTSIFELAILLGRMQKAEEEYEEEILITMEWKTKWKINHANKSDIIGIYESDDLSSLLTSETALLSDTDLEHLFYKKFLEKKLQTFEYEVKMKSRIEEEKREKRENAKEDTKGPIIICVDTSGSMQGTPEAVAKTLCLAILKIAFSENRKCYLISFSTQIATLNLTDIKNSLELIIDFLSMSFNGGTDVNPALEAALQLLATEDFKRADVLIISDFIITGLEKEIKSEITAAKENKTKFHSLVIGKSQNTKAIEDFDNHWLYDSSNKENNIILLNNLKNL